MAATTRQPIVIRDGSLDKWCIDSGITVYPGCFVGLTTEGLAINATSSGSALRAIGIAWDTAATSKTATADGSLAGGVIADANNVIDVYTAGKAEVAFNTLAQANVGAIAFLKDNNTLSVSSSDSANAEIVGFVTKYISSTKGEISLFGYSS